MRSLLYIVLMVFCFSQLAVSQQYNLDVDELDIPDSTVFKRSVNNPPKKLEFGVDVGLSYMFASNGVHGPAFSLSPYAYYPVSEKFGFSAGIIAETGSYYVPTIANDRVEMKMLPMTRMFIYGSGHYLVNEKLRVNGTVYQQVVDVPNRNLNAHPTTFNYRGMSAGFDYKLTKNITIGAQIRVESPNSPWNNSLYHGGGFAPYGW